VHHGVAVVAVVVAGVAVVACGGVRPLLPCRHRRHGASVAPGLAMMTMMEIVVLR